MFHGAEADTATPCARATDPCFRSGRIRGTDAPRFFTEFPFWIAADRKRAQARRRAARGCLMRGMRKAIVSTRRSGTRMQASEAAWISRAVQAKSGRRTAAVARGGFLQEV